MWSDNDYVQELLADLKRPVASMTPIRWDEEKWVDVCFITSPAVKEHITYVSIHQNCFELCIHSTEKKAKKLMAFLRHDGLFQAWNKRRPKLMKLLDRNGLFCEKDCTLRYMGTIFAEDSFQQYLNDLFDKILIVEQNREENRWEYEPLLS